MNTPKDKSEGVLAHRLLALKAQLERDKSQRAELQGELRGIMRQLEQEFAVHSLEEAEDLMVRREEALRELEEGITAQLAELEQRLPQ